MLRMFGKVRNTLLINEARSSSSVWQSSTTPQVITQPLVSCHSVLGGVTSLNFNGGVGRKLLSSMSPSLLQSVENIIHGGLFNSKPSTAGSQLPAEQRRSYFTKEGRIGWLRKRRIAREQREKILEPNSPVIDAEWPLPKDDTESLPPELFGEDVTTLSPEEEIKAQNNIVGCINKQIGNHAHGRLFAVVHVNGKQFKVTPEDIIIVQEYFPPTNGDQIRLNKVLLVGGKDFTLIGRPLIDNDLVRVEATVIEKNLSYTKMIFKMRKREQYRRLKFAKTTDTFLRINLIELMQPLDLIKPEFSSVGSVGHHQNV